MRAAVTRPHRLVGVGSDARPPDALLEVFFFEDVEANPRTAGHGRFQSPHSGAGEAGIPTLSPRPRGSIIEPEAGGFVLRSGPRLAAADFPIRMRLKLAYDVEGGDPFAGWSPFDFELDADSDGDLTVEAEGAEVTERAGNLLSVEAREPGFHVRVLGFDTRRDIKVQVHETRRGVELAAEH